MTTKAIAMRRRQPQRWKRREGFINFCLRVGNNNDSRKCCCRGRSMRWKKLDGGGANYLTPSTEQKHGKRISTSSARPLRHFPTKSTSIVGRGKPDRIPNNNDSSCSNSLSESQQCGFVQIASYSISSALWSRPGASSFFYHLLFLPRQSWKDGSVNIVLSGGWIHCDERWRYRLIPSWSTHEKMAQIMDVPKFWFPDRCNTTRVGRKNWFNQEGY